MAASDKLGIEPITIDRAIHRLETRLGSLSDGTEKELVASSVRSLQRLTRDIRGISGATHFHELHQQDLLESVGLAAKTDLDRSEIFWLWFRLFALFREIQFRSNGFNHEDLELYSSVAAITVGASPEERIRIDSLLIKLPAYVVDKAAAQALSDLQARAQVLAEPLQAITNRMSEWDEQIATREERLLALKGNLEGLTSKLNFLGLSGAFTDQIRPREHEKRLHVIQTYALGALLLAVPLLPVLAPSLFGITRLTWDDLPKVFPLAVLEAVLLYFFRIALLNYQSAKALLLQYELRRSLCAFVESYADFVTRLRKDQESSKVLERFEALVFSGITPDPQRVPSHFDGLEQIIRAVREVRGKPGAD